MRRSMTILLVTVALLTSLISSASAGMEPCIVGCVNATSAVAE